MTIYVLLTRKYEDFCSLKLISEVITSVGYTKTAWFSAFIFIIVVSITIHLGLQTYSKFLFVERNGHKL